jgi:hypothetical protein
VDLKGQIIKPTFEVGQEGTNILIGLKSSQERKRKWGLPTP